MIFSYISFETLEFQLNLFNFAFFILLTLAALVIPKRFHVMLIMCSGLFFVYSYSPVTFYLLVPLSLLLCYRPMRARVSDSDKMPLWLGFWVLYLLMLEWEDFAHYQVNSMFQFETLVLGCYNFMRGYNIYHELWLKKIRYSFFECLGFFWHGPVLFSGPLETIDEWSEYYRAKAMPIQWKKGFKLIGSSILMSLIGEAIFFYLTPPKLNFSEVSYFRVLIYAYSIGFVVHFRVASYINFTRGFSTLMGYPFGKPNFDRPYSVRSIASFWTRWHASIARWVREYLLFRNFAKFEGTRFLATITIYFLVVGIGHGWSLNFGLWGFLQGLGIVVNFIYLYAKYKIPGLLIFDQKYFSNGLKWFLAMAYLHLTWILLDDNCWKIYEVLLQPLGF